MMRKHAVDLAGHLAWAFAALVPALLLPGALGGALSGFVIAAPREFWDQRPKTGFTLRAGWSRILDIAGFVAGGALAGFVMGG